MIQSLQFWDDMGQLYFQALSKDKLIKWVRGDRGINIFDQTSPYVAIRLESLKDRILQ